MQEERDAVEWSKKKETGQSSAKIHQEFQGFISIWKVD